VNGLCAGRVVIQNGDAATALGYSGLNLLQRIRDAKLRWLDVQVGAFLYWLRGFGHSGYLSIPASISGCDGGFCPRPCGT
jgi:hypothetical protein